MIRATKLPPKLELTGDRQGNAATQVASATSGALNGVPDVASKKLGPFTFGAGASIRITHKLGRAPAEWRAIDVTGGYGAFQRTAWDATSITIQSANACTASFRVS